jgi:hypothetical protein
MFENNPERRPVNVGGIAEAQISHHLLEPAVLLLELHEARDF